MVLDLAMLLRLLPIRPMSIWLLPPHMLMAIRSIADFVTEGISERVDALIVAENVSFPRSDQSVCAAASVGHRAARQIDGDRARLGGPRYIAGSDTHCCVRGCTANSD